MAKEYQLQVDVKQTRPRAKLNPSGNTINVPARVTVVEYDPETEIGTSAYVDVELPAKVSKEVLAEAAKEAGFKLPSVRKPKGK